MPADENKSAPLPIPVKAPWETPRVTESAIKEHTAYYAQDDHTVPS
jgi:hypothetical protein